LPPLASSAESIVRSTVVRLKNASASGVAMRIVVWFGFGFVGVAPKT
jgi:hypothetical protein